MTVTSSTTHTTDAAIDKPLVIGGREFTSRLLIGTGKYRTFDEMIGAFESSGTQIITVALRRIDFDNPESRSVLEKVDWTRFQILPNTAGCATADEAIRIARLARSMGLSDWIKLEVIPDPVYLFPDPIGTLKAAEVLVKEGFHVLPYISDDPVLAKQLEEIGCATVMPLAAPIGSGQGLTHFDRIQIIINQSQVPVVVDAGIGAPSDASLAMEIGADAVLVNSAIALARDPVRMARAMSMGVEAGRIAYLSGRIEKRATASPSSPTTGISR
jgi:thiazole synthase